MKGPATPSSVPIDSWIARDTDPGAGDAGLIADLAGTPHNGWIDVPAPGDIYLALHAAGRLPDPFMDENEAACAWVKTREWWWRASFTAPSVGTGAKLALVFHGLDTFATLWLNGNPLGRSENMFRTVTFDIGALVLPAGENILVVRFDPASETVRDRSMPLWPIISDPILETRRNFIRKAQFGWGWDWAPRLPTVGIWRKVELTLRRTAALDSLYCRTVRISPSRDRADLLIDIGVEFLGAAVPAELDVIVSSPGGGVVGQATAAVTGAVTRFAFTVDRPELWWTPELGGQPLYIVDVTLRHGDVRLDADRRRVGLRTIALDLSPDPDEPGTSFFRFLLNGVAIFACGACWVPASSFVGAVDEAQYRRLIDAARDANMNMLRVWGGGVYEHEAFYDLCDEAGILVWQDFMFACAPYPEDDPAFVDNVRAEIHGQIRRLRNHPCLALWCGNNEAQAVQGFMNRMTGSDDVLHGRLYYDRIMPDAVACLDPATPYWPGSPTGGPSHNSMRAGDVHSWTVWHGLPPVPDEFPVGNLDFSPEGIAYTRYAEDMARFVSEFGIQASPSMATLHRCLPASTLALGHPALENRIKDKPKDKVNGMLLPVTGLPSTLQEYVDYTQIVQAEGLKFGIEHFRRRKPHCSGTLIWQYNDCWPCISWSLLDYYGVGKAAYYATRRAYQPVMASFQRHPSGAVELWISNDTLRTVTGSVTVALHDLHTGKIWHDAMQVDVPPNASQAVWCGDAGRFPASASNILTVASDEDRFPWNRLFFAPVRHIDLPPMTMPAMDIIQIDAHRLRVHLRSPQYAFLVHMLVKHEWTRFSDNYFDMRPEECRTIDITNRDIRLMPEDIAIRRLL